MPKSLSDQKSWVRTAWDNLYLPGFAKVTSSAGGSAFTGRNFGAYIDKGTKWSSGAWLTYGFRGLFSVGTGGATFINNYFAMLRKSKNKPATDAKSLPSEAKAIAQPITDECCHFLRYEHKGTPVAISGCSKFLYGYLVTSTMTYALVGAASAWLQLESLIGYEENCDVEINIKHVLQFGAFNIVALGLGWSQLSAQLSVGIPQQKEYFNEFIVKGKIANVSWWNIGKAILISGIGTASVWYSNPALANSLSQNTWLCRLPTSGWYDAISKGTLTKMSYSISSIGCLFNFSVNAFKSLAAFHKVGNGSSQAEIDEYLKELGLTENPKLRSAITGSAYSLFAIDAFTNIAASLIAFTDLPKDETLLYNPYLIAGGLVLGLINFLNVFSIDQENFRRELKARVLLKRATENYHPVATGDRADEISDETEKKITSDSTTAAATSDDVKIDVPADLLGRTTDPIIQPLLPNSAADSAQPDHKSDAIAAGPTTAFSTPPITIPPKRTKGNASPSLANNPHGFHSPKVPISNSVPNSLAETPTNGGICLIM